MYTVGKEGCLGIRETLIQYGGTMRVGGPGQKLIALLFTPITGFLLLMFGTVPLILIPLLLLETLFKAEPTERFFSDFEPFLLGVMAITFGAAYFLNRAICTSLAAPVSSTDDNGVQVTDRLIGRTILYGVIGSVAPHVLATLTGMVVRSWRPDITEAIYTYVGYIGTMTCPPTAILGAILGSLLVWAVVRFRRPKWLSVRIEDAADARWIFIIAFWGGFLATVLFNFTATYTLTLLGSR